MANVTCPNSPAGSKVKQMELIPPVGEGHPGPQGEGWAVCGTVPSPAGGCDVLWGGNVHPRRRAVRPGPCGLY